MRFEWDKNKAKANLEKHWVAFEDAAHVFGDTNRVELHENKEAYDEDRFLTVGLVGDVELAVVYTVRDDAIRIISARKADRNERKNYWKDR